MRARRVAAATPPAPWAARETGLAIAASALAMAACSGPSTLPDAGSIFASDADGTRADARGESSADADGPGRDAEPGIDASRGDTYELTGQTQTMTRRGGSGGDEYAISCSEGSVAFAISGRSGSRVDQLRLHCDVLRDDGSLAGDASETATTGGGGGDPFSEICPAGEAIAALRGRAGSEVDAIGIECAPVLSWVDDGADLHAVGDEHGGGGGDPFRDECSPGWFVARLEGRSGSRIDAIQGSCSEIVNRSAPTQASR